MVTKGAFSPDNKRQLTVISYDHFINGDNIAHTVYIRTVANDFQLPASDFDKLMHKARRDFYLSFYPAEMMIVLKKAKITKIMRDAEEDTFRITCKDFLEYSTETEDLSE